MVNPPHNTPEVLNISLTAATQFAPLSDKYPQNRHRNHKPELVTVLFESDFLIVRVRLRQGVEMEEMGKSLCVVDQDDVVDVRVFTQLMGLMLRQIDARRAEKTLLGG